MAKPSTSAGSPPTLLARASNVVPPVDRKRLAQATDWMSRLQGSPDEKTALQCLRWRQAHADNETIWQRLCAMRGDFASTCALASPDIAVELLELAATRGARRHALKWIVTGGAVAGLAWSAKPLISWPVLMADAQTGTGELRTMSLKDGTRIVMGPGTALDLNLDQEPRSIVLLAGEIMVTTGRRGVSSPLAVMTRHGMLTPVGTRYSVHDKGDGQRCDVAVFEGAVDVRARSNGLMTRLQAGQRAELQSSGLGPVLSVAPGEDAWTHGMLLADQMRLGAFVEHIARYRAGIVRCDPAVAHLEVVGTFPLTDTEGILNMLPRVLPVQVRYRTRYWVTVSAAD